MWYYDAVPDGLMEGVVSQPTIRNGASGTSRNKEAMEKRAIRDCERCEPVRLSNQQKTGRYG